MKKLFFILIFSVLSSFPLMATDFTPSVLQLLESSEAQQEADIRAALDSAHESGVSAKKAAKDADEKFRGSVERQNTDSRREELRRRLREKRTTQRAGNFPVLKTLERPHQLMDRRVRLDAKELENASGGFRLTQGHLHLWGQKGKISCGKSWYGRLPSWKGLLWEEYKVQGMIRDFRAYLEGEESAHSTYSYQHNYELFSLVPKALLFLKEAREEMKQFTSSLGEEETVFRVDEFKLETHQFKNKDAIESFTKKEAQEYISSLIEFVKTVQQELSKRPCKAPESAEASAAELSAAGAGGVGDEAGSKMPGGPRKPPKKSKKKKKKKK